MAGSTGHFAVATASGTILYFNSATLALEGRIAFNTQEASAHKGGSQIFSTSFNVPSGLTPPPTLRISPDGTLIATSQTGLPLYPTVTTIPGTNLLHNGGLVTAFSGLPVGWLDGSRLLVNPYAKGASTNSDLGYTGCSIYGADGNPTGGLCALGWEVAQLQSGGSDVIYVPAANETLSVSTEAVGWMSADPFASTLYEPASLAAIAGSRAIFVSGTHILAQSFGN